MTDQNSKAYYPLKLLRRKEVERRTGLRRSSIYAYMAQGRFPQRVKIGPGAVGWIEEEVDEFVRVRARNRMTGRQDSLSLQSI